MNSFTQAATNGQNVPSVKSVESKAVNAQNLVGGWYPVFFDQYSESGVAQVVSSIKAQKVKRILISFDKNKSLALKIGQYIYAQTKFSPEFQYNHHEDDTARYDHNRVVLIIWSK